MKGFFANITWKRLLFSLLLLLIVGVVSVAGYTQYRWNRLTQEWYQPLARSNSPSQLLEGKQADTYYDSLLFPAERPRLWQTARALKPFTLLLVGIDSREGERSRSDTMILAAVHPARQKVYMLSIPRDSLVQLPGRGMDKINHAMAYGGPSLLKSSLERFFNLRIDRYVTVDFDGFRKIVDELGGVEVVVQKRMKYTDPSDHTTIDLYPGKQILDGKKALDYARYRLSDLGKEDSDWQRIQRQQEIIRALANKARSASILVKLFPLMQVIGTHVKTDLTREEIQALIAAFYDFRTDVLETETLLGRDQRIWRHGTRGWYYLVPESERIRVKQKIQALLDGDGKR